MKQVLLSVMAGTFLYGRLYAQPVITIQPTNQVVLANSTNTVLQAQVSASGFFSYQWFFNGTNLPNANIITTVTGTIGSPGVSGNGGAATNARLYSPFGVAADSIGNILIADSLNNQIRKVDTNGIITRIAGTNFSGYSGDGGPATSAKLSQPDGVAVDNWGNIYIADVGNARIRKVNTNGIITTVAGNGTNGFFGDGAPGTNAEINGNVDFPYGMCLDASGNLYFADTRNNRIRKLDTNGIISTLVIGGSGGSRGGIAIDANGNLYFSSAIFTNGYVFKMDTNGIVTTFAGGGTTLMDGVVATNAQLFPFGLCTDTNGNLYIGELGGDSANYYGANVRKVDTNGIVTTVAGRRTRGGAPFSGVGGPATNAYLSCPYTVAIDCHGNLLIADQCVHVIRQVWLTGWPAIAFPSLSPGLSGDYQVVATSSSGSVTSSVANLSIVYPPITGTFSGNNFSLICPVFLPSVLQVQWSSNVASATWSNIDVINWPLTSSAAILRNYPATNFSEGFYRVSWLQ